MESTCIHHVHTRCCSRCALVVVVGTIVIVLGRISMFKHTYTHARTHTKPTPTGGWETATVEGSTVVGSVVGSSLCVSCRRRWRRRCRREKVGVVVVSVVGVVVVAEPVVIVVGIVVVV